MVGTPVEKRTCPNDKAMEWREGKGGRERNKHAYRTQSLNPFTPKSAENQNSRQIPQFNFAKLLNINGTM